MAKNYFPLIKWIELRFDLAQNLTGVNRKLQIIVEESKRYFKSKNEFYRYRLRFVHLNLLSRWPRISSGLRTKGRWVIRNSHRYSWQRRSRLCSGENHHFKIVRKVGKSKNFQHRSSHWNGGVRFVRRCASIRYEKKVFFLRNKNLILMSSFQPTSPSLKLRTICLITDHPFLSGIWQIVCLVTCMLTLCIRPFGLLEQQSCLALTPMLTDLNCIVLKILVFTTVIGVLR